MSRSAVVIVALAALLVGSNAWWAYRLFDVAISFTHLEDSYRADHAALRQALAVIHASAVPGATRESILASATKSAAGPVRVFEKEGFLWVGDLGLRFSEGGQLLEASPSTSSLP